MSSADIGRAGSGAPRHCRPGTTGGRHRGGTLPGLGTGATGPVATGATGAGSDGAGSSEAGQQASGAAVIELASVSKEYPGGVAALQGVNLTVWKGELLAIVGPSGSGKSTLLHIVGTLDRPTTGTVRIAGHDTAGLRDRELSALRAQHIGFVFQAFHLVSGISALDNVAEGLLYCGLPRQERRRRAAEALGRVGLADRRDHHPHELSGGQRQRVAIARAVAGEPDLLLADEPTGALDTASGEAVMALLHELSEQGATIAVITHDMEIAQSLPRQVRLRDGRIVADTAHGAAGPPGSVAGPAQEVLS